MRNKKIILLMLLFSFNSMYSQETLASQAATLDTSIRHGQLKNGLTYFIKPTSTPDEDIQLWLYIKAGVNQESKDQLSMGHFVEHMAFKSSDNYEKGIHNHLLNAQFEVNGHSGNKVTEYKFKFPSNNTDVLNVGFLWFGDIINGGLRLTGEDIDKERGIYLQEYISGGAMSYQNYFTENQLRYQLLPGSQDMNNFNEHIQRFDPGVVRSYYKDWYSPDRTAIAIVGNLKDVDSIEKEIISRFGGIPISPEQKHEVNQDSAYYNQPLQFGMVQREPSFLGSANDQIDIHLYYRDRKTYEQLASIKGLKRLMNMAIFIDILNKRFEEKLDVYDQNFEVRAQYGYGELEIPPSLRIVINTSSDENLEALDKTIQILHQLQQYGAATEEVQMAVQRQLGDLDSKADINYWTSSIKSHFIWGEALPHDKSGFYHSWLSGYSQKDLNEFLKDINLQMPEDIGLIVSSNLDKKTFSEARVRQIIHHACRKEVAPYSLPVIPKNIMSKEKKKKLRNNDWKDLGYGASGAREFLLKNGIKIILNPFQPTGVHKDRIYVQGFSPIGALAFPREDYFSAINSPHFIKNSGIGILDKFKLQRFLNTSSIYWSGIDLSISDSESGVRINSSPEDFETMMELIYLYFTNAKTSQPAFDDWKRREKKNYEELSGNIQNLDLLSNIKISIGNDSRKIEGTTRRQGLERTDMQRGFEIYNKIFGNIQTFTFIVSGNFSIDSVTPILKKYLGSLKHLNESNLTKKKKRDEGFRPNGPVFYEFFAPKQSSQNILYKPYFIKPAKETHDWKETVRVEALGAVTNTRVWDLRFIKGLSLYDTGSFGEFNDSEKRYELSSDFSCLPEDFPLIRKEYHIIYKNLRSSIISQDELSKSLSRMLMLSDPYGRGNSQRTVLNKLYTHYRYNLPWTETAAIHDYIKTLTPEDILETARKYYTEDNFYEFLLKSQEESN